MLIGHAVRPCWLKQNPEHAASYEEMVSLAWQAFYQLPPHAVAYAVLDATMHWLKQPKQTP